MLNDPLQMQCFKKSDSIARASKTSPKNNLEINEEEILRENFS